MNEDKYTNDFQIIAYAGDAKSQAMLAILAAKEGDFDKAEKCLHTSETEMNQAHEMQFKMLQEEANGEKVDINIVTIHAQDHITMAIVTHDLAVQIIELYKQVYLLTQNNQKS